MASKGKHGPEPSFESESERQAYGRDQIGRLASCLVAIARTTIENIESTAEEYGLRLNETDMAQVRNSVEQFGLEFEDDVATALDEREHSPVLRLVVNNTEESDG